MQFSPASCFSLSGPNIILSTLFSNTLNPCFSLKVRAQLFQTHMKPTGKIIGIWGSHGSEDVDCGLLGFHATWTCRWLPTVWSHLLPDYMIQHPRRWPSSFSSPWEPEISQNFSFVYFNLYGFEQEIGWQKILTWKVARILQTLSVFFLCIYIYILNQ
jgi:hypothetical protein